MALLDAKEDSSNPFGDLLVAPGFDRVTANRRPQHSLAVTMVIFCRPDAEGAKELRPEVNA